VREAIALTIDSNSIIKTASLADDPTNQVLPKNAPGYSQSIKAQAHNLDTARQRLQQAGYGGGVTLRFAYGSSESPTAVMLKSQLAEVGINVALLPQASSQSLEAIYQAGTADFYLLSYTVSNLDSGGVLLSER
jgi:ABC-type transport system substrate-binding protein